MDTCFRGFFTFQRFKRNTAFNTAQDCIWNKNTHQVHNHFKIQQYKRKVLLRRIFIRPLEGKDKDTDSNKQKKQLPNPNGKGLPPRIQLVIAWSIHLAYQFFLSGLDPSSRFRLALIFSPSASFSLPQFLSFAGLLKTTL